MKTPPSFTYHSASTLNFGGLQIRVLKTLKKKKTKENWPWRSQNIVVGRMFEHPFSRCMGENDATKIDLYPKLCKLKDIQYLKPLWVSILLTLNYYYCDINVS